MSDSGPALRDIHLPPDPGWWPPAPGWWMVALVVLAMILWLLLAWRRRARSRRRLRRVVAEVDAIAAQYAAQADPAALAAQVSMLLRRASLLLDPRAAALHGESWLTFLDARGGSDEFSHGAGRVLIDAPWQRAPDVDAPALLALARRWLAQAMRERTRV